MNVTVDPRRGSQELVTPLRNLGVGVVEEHLSFGDVSILGEGPGGAPMPIGVERKTLGDLLSCIVDKRFAGHQLEGLHNSYQKVFLLVEGEYAISPEGDFTVKRWENRRPIWVRPPGRAWTWSAVEGWLMSMRMQGGVHVVNTNSLSHSAVWIQSLASWATVGWDQHHSTKVFHEKARPFSYAKVTAESQFAASLPGIGWEKAQRAAEKFETIEEMVLADPEEWMEIDGIGKGTAEKIIKHLRVRSRR
jgi:ERCC4-type nuclease